MNHPVLAFVSLPSTSTYLKESYASLASGSVVIADSQTAGRGRLGRSWEDGGGSLLFSLLIKGRGLERIASKLPLLAGEAMGESLIEAGFNPCIKWPNDIYLGNKKCCGILVEGISNPTLEALILGVGLNISQTEFSPNLNATSLCLEKKGNFSKESILNSFLNNLDRLLEDPTNLNELPLVKNSDYLKGKTVRLNYYGENLTATCLGISPQGKLVIKTEEGEEKEITSGEAQILKGESGNIN